MVEVEGLSLGTKFIESIGLPANCQGVLDVRGKSTVVDGIEGSFIKAGKGSELVEVDVVLGYLVGVFHSKVVEFVQGHGYGVRLTEGGLHSFLEVIPENGIIRQVIFVKF